MKWLQKVMYGRYGTDKLNRVLSAIILFLFVINLFHSSAAVFTLSLFCLIVLYLRTFSKNHRRRYEENQRFLKYWQPLEKNCRIRIRQLKELRTHRYFKCKSCGQFIRIPRQKGQLEISCPKCRSTFVGRT